ncbi:MAG: 50S ribosomal protein L11 methyltransferase [Ignavibacteriales bacterium]|nr:50S ribosomal protein L11 methyltransferase [Ignavibacteriales bacterium]
MITRRWERITVALPSDYQDLLIGHLALAGVKGFLQDEHGVTFYLPERLWSGNMKTRILRVVHDYQREFPRLDLSVTTRFVRDQNWNRLWERQTGIVAATPNILIKPSWQRLPRRDRNKIILHIDPKMSFGTGHHETTRLSLRVMEQYFGEARRVLDFGCGTGVLAIAAAKLGAHRVLAIDNDSWSTINARENVRRNRVERCVKVVEGGRSKIPRAAFDLIVANIDYLAITRCLPALAKRLSSASLLILSGLLESDLSLLKSHFDRLNLRLVNIDQEHEWAALVLRKV